MKFETRAKINGLFNDIESRKSERKKIGDIIKAKEEEIINALEVGQEVIVYKNDKEHVLTVKVKRSTKFDKSELANDIGVSQTKLNIPGVTELTEKGKLNSSNLDKYWTEEEDLALKVRRASKKDVERLMQTDLADFIE